MFVSTRDQGTSRRSRVYGVSKAARSSKLSLLSAASGISTTSTGSNSTVTQDSYSRSRNPSGRTRRKRRSRGDKDDDTAGGDSVPTTISQPPDVFDFLVDENARRAAAKEDAASCDEVTTSRRDDAIVESDPEHYYRGHSSDSGISMGSSIGDPHNTTLLPTLMEDTNEHLYSSASSVADCACFQQDSQSGWQEFPSGCYHCQPVPPSPASHASFFPQPVPPYNLPPLDQTTSTPIVFRDKSGSRSSPRLFRRFKRINVRSLLQIQARIAELEHDLRAMDISFTTNLQRDKERPGQLSREDQLRRTQMYEELRAHLDQYYQALIAAHQIEAITKAPTAQETQSFRKWVESHILNRSKVPPLMSEDTDLVCFKPPEKPDSQPLVYRIIALSAFTNLLIPLMLFKFLSGILNRLIFWSVVIVAGAMTMEKLGLRAEKIYTTCIIAFGGISLGAALSLQS